MLNDLSSPAAFVATRRSGKPREMVTPGPDEVQLARILTAAMRVPDHGKLEPWRFVVIGKGRRDDFASMLQQAWRSEHGVEDRPDIAAIDQFAHQAPTLVAVLSTPVADAKIPVWEQELSAGAACMTMLAAAHAEGFVGGWLTGWAAYSSAVAEALGHPGAKIAGFIFVGTPGKEPEERPRPSDESIVSRW
ncbi:nitroreductase [Sphingomonas sp. CGMCC 1.13654]|uniref:Putative NAD(P)H nitroreductase n=1 Tax=Sphingomonas chungangi TaxID=2683589 RepID=A0A838L3C2_9SPHN|nr:nitroreductase [Sphingomonas chungangi]MBA2933165.1 nitroreductase [Sphingomonas chungangi]MVW57837.1 nitroreductase [Sphingomonas chungangi]